jgi:nitrogen fixation protein FixH
MNRQFTGRHMAAILVAFFGVVIIVNLIMARFAVGTFGGIVVENTYVASQHFNRWLAQAEASEALGWDAEVERQDNGRLAVQLTGAPSGVTLSGEARHPLGHQPDAALTFEYRGAGQFLSREALPAGRWILRLAATDGERIWRQEKRLP